MKDLDAIITSVAGDGGDINMDAYSMARALVERKVVRITDHHGKSYDHTVLKAFFALVDELKEIV